VAANSDPGDARRRSPSDSAGSLISIVALATRRLPEATAPGDD
jgi:hypothetical protein